MVRQQSGTHENFQRPVEIKASSERSFGLVFAAVFCLVAGWTWWHGAARAGWWLVPAVAFALAGLFAPGVLAPLNRLWVKLGLVLYYVVNPIVLGVLFYLVFVPIGLLMRLSGKDPLRVRFDRDADSYWIRRDPPGPAPHTMKNQF